jgi:flagellar basal body-associated protein FliL
MTEQAQKPKKKKKVWLILLLAAVVIGVIVAVSGGGDKEKTATPVAVADLIDAYTSNEVSADQQYEDQYLEITGTVASIGTRYHQYPYITFDKGGFLK